MCKPHPAAPRPYRPIGVLRTRNGAAPPAEFLAPKTRAAGRKKSAELAIYRSGEEKCYV